MRSIDLCSIHASSERPSQQCNNPTAIFGTAGSERILLVGLYLCKVSLQGYQMAQCEPIDARRDLSRRICGHALMVSVRSYDRTVAGNADASLPGV